MYPEVQKKNYFQYKRSVFAQYLKPTLFSLFFSTIQEILFKIFEIPFSATDQLMRFEYIPVVHKVHGQLHV